jgi:hypothetical protein
MFFVILQVGLCSPGCITNEQIQLQRIAKIKAYLDVRATKDDRDDDKANGGGLESGEE